MSTRPMNQISEQNGAEMAVKKDRLLIFKAGTAKTASGKDLPLLRLHATMAINFDTQNKTDSDYTQEYQSVIMIKEMQHVNV